MEQPVAVTMAQYDHDDRLRRRGETRVHIMIDGNPENRIAGFLVK
jgi:hypothetical protein